MKEPTTFRLGAPDRSRMRHNHAVCGFKVEACHLLAAAHAMSAWRRIATEKIPKQRELIQRSESVGMLWVDLWLRFVDAHHEPVDEETIRGVYEFAKWTLQDSRSAEMATSTCCHFYEQLPTEPSLRAQMRRFMTREDIFGLSEIFKYHLTPDEHQKFMREFSAPRTSPNP